MDFGLGLGAGWLAGLDTLVPLPCACVRACSWRARLSLRMTMAMTLFGFCCAALP